MTEIYCVECASANVTFQRREQTNHCCCRDCGRTFRLGYAPPRGSTDAQVRAAVNAAEGNISVNPVPPYDGPLIQ